MDTSLNDGEGSEVARLSGARLGENPLSLTYCVKDRVTLPSDGVARRVQITVLGFSAALKYVCVPRRTSAVFIEGWIKNTSEYELLEGPVNMFMDDSFVMKTQLGVRTHFCCSACSS